MKQNDDCIFLEPLWVRDFVAWDKYCENIYRQVQQENPDRDYDEIFEIYNDKIQTIIERNKIHGND